MTMLSTRKEEYLTDNVIDFTNAKVALGGKGPTDENWLKNLKPGTVFLARPKTKMNQEKPIILNKYWVLEHKTMSSNLMVATPDRNQMNIWTPTLEFSRQFELIEEIGYVEFGYEDDHTNDKSEQTDGNSEGSVQSDRVD